MLSMVLYRKNIKFTHTQAHTICTRTNFLHPYDTIAHAHAHTHANTRAHIHTHGHTREKIHSFSIDLRVRGLQLYVRP